ncbi:MAG: hypothetical protein JXB39_12840 [Deltaproteobacteria bacterium]|nr:hypothetical protein [Deltaproteobacteria bacterium]
MQSATLLMGLSMLLSCDRIPWLPGHGRSQGPDRQSEVVDVDCSTREGRPPREDCVSKRLACSDTVKSTTAGGTSVYSDDFYRGKYCLPSFGGYDGPERVYLLDLPPQTEAEIYLDGQCADLDLFAFRWGFDGACPGTAHPISECEADAGNKGTGHVHVETVTRAATYFIVVDGKGSVTAPFAVTVECRPRP